MTFSASELLVFFKKSCIYMYIFGFGGSQFLIQLCKLKIIFFCALLLKYLDLTPPPTEREWFVRYCLLKPYRNWSSCEVLKWLVTACIYSLVNSPQRDKIRALGLRLCYIIWPDIITFINVFPVQQPKQNKK